jgi:hypothetical protein
MGLGLVVMLSSSALLIGLNDQTATQNIDPMTRHQMAIQIAAADERMPSVAIIEMLEATLSQDACVGDISLWDRRYAFGLNDSDALSTDKINFSLKRVHAGALGDQKILTYRLFPELDDSEFDRVDGYYVPSIRRVKVAYCGPNRSRSPQGV